MRRVRYQVACSLDGYIAGPDGEIDWITGGDDFDFNALFAQFDTLLMGRKTYEALPDGGSGYGASRIVVASRTLHPADHPDIEIVRTGLKEHVAALKQMPGRDIWLFGGGELFRALLEAGLVDTIEPAVIPVVLGGGVPMYPVSGRRTRLSLTGQRRYEGGMILLEYQVIAETGAAT